MNPITRMMKRYIKTPLKYALPLLFIGSLALVSISGCTSSTNTTTSSATPTATPTGNDPLLAAIVNQETAAGYPTPSQGAWGGVNASAKLLGSVLMGNDNDSVNILHFNSVANATADYNLVASSNEARSVRNETPIYWGLSGYTTGAGHAPTVKKAVTYYTGGDYQTHETAIQYDSVVISYSHDDNPNGT